MKSHQLYHFILAILCVLLAWETSVIRVAAQPPNENSTKPANKKNSVHTPSSLSKKKEEIAGNTELDEETKKRALDAYTLAIASQKKSSDNKNLVAQNLKEAEQATKHAERLKKELTDLLATEPMLPQNDSIKELEKLLVGIETEIARLKMEEETAKKEITQRPENAKVIRQNLPQIPGKIDQYKTELENLDNADLNPIVRDALKAELSTRIVALESEEQALNTELARYDAEERTGLLKTKLDLLTQQLSYKRKMEKLITSALMKKKAESAKIDVENAQNAVIEVDPTLKPYAVVNQELAEEVQKITVSTNQYQIALQKVNAELELVEKSYNQTYSKVEQIGLTNAIGTLLRREKSRLSIKDIELTDPIVLQQTIEETHYKLLDYTDQRLELSDPEPLIQEILTKNRSNNKGENDQLLEKTVRNLIADRQEFLDALNKNYQALFEVLIELDSSNNKYQTTRNRYLNYIDERVLWIRSNREIWSHFSIDLNDKWLSEKSHWLAGWSEWKTQFSKEPIPFSLIFLVTIVLIYLRSHFKRVLKSLSVEGLKANQTSVIPTLRATLLTFLVSCPFSLILILMGWKISYWPNEQFHFAAFGSGCMQTGFYFLALEFFRNICYRHGLGVAHLNWPKNVTSHIHTNLTWLLISSLPIWFILNVLLNDSNEPGTDLIERFSLILLMLLVLLFCLSFFLRKNGFDALSSLKSMSWLTKLKYPLLILLCAIPAAYMILAVLGYYYTAIILMFRTIHALILIMSFMFLRSVLLRIITLQKRKLSIQQARQKRLAALAETGQTSAEVTNPSLQPDLGIISEQSRRLVNLTVQAIIIVGLYFILIDILPALKGLENWKIWTTTVNVTVPPPSENGLNLNQDNQQADELPTTREVTRNVTVVDLGIAIIVACITIIAARNLPGLIEFTLLKQLEISAAFRYTAINMASYFILLVGSIYVFQTLGLGWSKVQWLVTALTFGLGFGLQEIFANFVAGIILLFEQPIRVGDIVTVDGVSGTVTKIKIRATTITNWDRQDYVIPNKDFITGRVLNWTLSDSINRLTINVGVAYDSNVIHVRELLHDIVASQVEIMKDPQPIIFFEQFGDSCLNFRLLLYLSSPDNRLKVTHEIHEKILLTFKEHGIEIPFPQRDLNINDWPPVNTDPQKTVEVDPKGPHDVTTE